MPVVTFQITREGCTPGSAVVTGQQKAALIDGATKLLRDVLNKPEDSTFVIITEVEKENWGWGGLPIDWYREKKSSASETHACCCCG